MDYFDTLTEAERSENLRLLEKYERKNKKHIEEKKEINSKDVKDKKERKEKKEKKKEEKVILPLEIPDKPEAALFRIGYDQLNDFQKPIIKECIDKGFAGLSLPLGSGKTIISIIVGLYLSMDDKNPMLIVVSKSLISNWEDEIKKFYQKRLKYRVIHSDNYDIDKWKIKSSTKLILTTIDVLTKYYKENSIDKDYITQRIPNRFGNYINYYEPTTRPFLNHVIGGGLFYSLEWPCLIVDEAQTYTNIETQRCQSLGALHCKHRWLLSGGLFDEPKAERILGYHVMLNVHDVPRNLPDTKKFITAKDSKFKGLNEHLISRKTNTAFIPPAIKDEIVSHVLLPEEVKIYTMMKQILIQVRNKAEKAKLLKNTQDVKKFSSYKLVMIMYLRQALLCPLLPITSIAIDAADMEHRSELSVIIMNEIRALNLDAYLNDVNSIKSTRIGTMLNCVDNHKQDRVIIFSCFKSFLDIMIYFLKDRKNIFYMESKMNMDQRGDLINDFRKADNGILLMTYDLGAVGFNLQCANTVMFADQFWNAKKTNQGVGRIFRYGQLAETINLYFFSANTGIEKIIFEKQKFKLQVLEELEHGTIKSQIPKVSIDEVIKIIELEDNLKSMRDVKYY